MQNELKHHLRVEPYPYQREGIVYGLDKKRLIIGDAPGLGKTLQAIGIVDTADAYPCLVICPSSLKINWQREFEKFTGKSAIVLDNAVRTTWPYLLKTGMHQMAVVNYESLRKYFVWDIKGGKSFRLKDVVFCPHIKMFKSVIIDESHRCLHYDSLILTKEHGCIKIGQIVENQYTDLHVASYDFSRKCVTFNRIKQTLRYERDKRLFKISAGDHSLITTEDHKIYVDGFGWKETSRLQGGENLYLLRKDFYDTESRENDGGMLFQKVCDYNDREKSGNKSEKTCSERERGPYLPMVWKGIYSETQSEESWKEQILFPKLRGKVEGSPTDSYREQQIRSEKGEVESLGKKTNGRPEDKATSFRQDENQQSDVRREMFGENESIHEREAYTQPWWKRSLFPTAIDALQCFRAYGKKLGIYCKHKICQTSFRENSLCLQDRHSHTGKYAGNRNRWFLSFGKIAEKIRREERLRVECVRLDSIEVYKPTSEGGTGNGLPKDRYVYDLEIETTHNYFANGILVHNCKDPSAQQTIFTKGITTGKEWIVLLSGTPVVNRPEDLVAQLSIMGRLQEFGGRTKFVADYCTDPKDKKAEPAVPLSVLSDKLYASCMIRRDKAKVLPQLPDKTRVDLYVDISNGPEYSLAAADLAEYLRQYKVCTDREIRRKMRMEALVRFMTLRRLATLGKVAQAVDFIRTFLSSGKKLIVFCSLHEVVDALCKAFPDAVTVTGRDSAAGKQASVDAFQNNADTRLIICSIKAAGVGLTLTAASSVAFLELPWTFCDCCQCEDRAHRIGQKDNVTCYYLLAEGTIDHAVYNLIQDKKNVANQIMNSDDNIPVDEIYFDQLVKMFMDS